MGRGTSRVPRERRMPFRGDTRDVAGQLTSHRSEKWAPSGRGSAGVPSSSSRVGGTKDAARARTRNMPPRARAPLGTKVVPLTRNRYRFSAKGLDISPFSVIIRPLATLTEGVQCCIRYPTRHPAGRCPPETATRLIAIWKEIIRTNKHRGVNEETPATVTAGAPSASSKQAFAAQGRLNQRCGPCKLTP